MAASQRRKGATGEREAAHFWSAVFPSCHRRACGEESQTAQGRDLADSYPLCIQVKTMARPDPLRALAEACVAAQPSEIPVAHVRRVKRNVPAGEPPVCCLRATDLRLLVAIYERFRVSFPKRVEEIRAELDGDE